MADLFKKSHITPEQFRKLYLCEWDTSLIERDERIVRNGIRQGLTDSQIANMTHLSKRDVMSIRSRLSNGLGRPQ